MPTFDFFKVTTKKERVVKKNSTDGKYSVIQKNLDGIVHIDIEANYYVKVFDKTYPIISENYDCKNIPEVYAQGLDEKGHRMLWIRNNINSQSLPKQYLPFAPGIKVYGNIVLNNYTKQEMFKIKKICYDEHTNEGYDALKFYKDNYDTIHPIIRSKWKD